MFNNLRAKYKGGSFAILTSEPHRFFFAAAILWLISKIFWWLTYLGHKYFHYLPKYQFDVKEIHSVLMLYVVLAGFVMGFLLTVIPRWLGGAVIPKWVYSLLFLLIPVGGIGVWSGTKLYLTSMIPGMVMVVLGYLLLNAVFAVYLTKSPHRASPHYGFFFKTVQIALLSGFVGVTYYLMYLLEPSNYQYYRISYGIGAYFFIPLLILTVCFRMVPFFTSILMNADGMNSYKWILPSWMFLLAAKTVLFVYELQAYYVISDGLLLLVTLKQFQAWQFLRKKPEMLLSYLYIALAWFPIGAALFVAGSVHALLGDGFYSMYFELAALHAWALGFYTTMIFAMVTRVSLGHSGRELKAGKFENRLFWWLQAGVVLRVLLELGGLIDPTIAFWVWVSGMPLLIALVPWGWRYLPYYFTPRVDAALPKAASEHTK